MGYIDSEIGKVPCDAIIKDLGDCISLIIDHRGKTPKKLGGDWIDSGIPAISAKNIHGGKLDNVDSIRFVSQEIYEKWMSVDVSRGDCFLVSEGATLGEFLYWDEDYPIVLSQRLFCIRTNPDILYSKYLYAYMGTSNFKRQVIGRATGSSVDGLRQTEVLKLQVPIIPLERQKVIGDLLYYIEKKQKELSRQNETLEQIAQTLFKRWFVDFEFSNGEGQPYRSSGGKMVESELGEIPEGWSVGELGEIVKLSNGKTSLERNENGLVPVFGSNGKIGACNEGNRYNTIIIGRVGSYCGSLFYYLDSCWVTDNAMTAEMFNSEQNSFLFEILKRANLNKRSTGSGQPLINQSILNSIELVIPPSDMISNYSEVASKLYKKIFENSNEIQTLTEFRNTLLPKLMNGEVRVNKN